VPFGVARQGQVTLVAIVFLVRIVALLSYAPVGIVRELRRPPDEQLPEWMGTVRGRRLRLAIVLGVFGLVAAGVWVVTVLGG
jgi:hypothetical protein